MRPPDLTAQAPSPLLRLRGISKAYRNHVAVHPTDMDIEEGEFVAILGPSGCGKTTLLRMIGGFVEPDGGDIAIDGASVTRMPPERRPTNMVFQGYGLFPHLSVRQNVGYGLRIAGRRKSEIDRMVGEMLDIMRLADLGDRPVTALSGGQQQRAALARALILRPKVLLLDEPLAALDLKLRMSMQEELLRIHREIGGTFLFVTHDQTEAMAMASRIAIMQGGRVVQEGSPADVYRYPANAFVAGFVGDANILPTLVNQGVVSIGDGQFAAGLPDGAANAVLRPEAIELNGAGRLRFEGVVERVVFIGSVQRVALRLADGFLLRLDRPANETVPAAGQHAVATIAAEDAIFLSTGS